MRLTSTATFAGFAALASLLVGTTPARAEPPTPPPSPQDPTAAAHAAAVVNKTSDTPITPATVDDATNKEEDESNTKYWDSGRARTFVASTTDVGYLYLRPRLSFGYGKPYVRWVGIDVNPAASNRFLSGYGGIRAALPLVDLRVGARYVWAFQQYFLAPNDNYHRLDFESQALSRSQYTSLEAELAGGVPVGPGSIITLLSGTMFTGTPAGEYVYDETLRVIVKPPYVGRARLGYDLRLGKEGKVSIGIVADVLWVPGRDAYILRAGFIGSAKLSDHVEVLGSVVPPLISPDSIGVAGGDFAQLGIRYRWATGSPPERAAPAQLQP